MRPHLNFLGSYSLDFCCIYYHRIGIIIIFGTKDGTLSDTTTQYLRGLGRYNNGYFTHTRSNEMETHHQIHFSIIPKIPIFVEGGLRLTPIHYIENGYSSPQRQSMVLCKETFFYEYVIISILT